MIKNSLGFQDVETSDQRWTSKLFSSVIDFSKVIKLFLCSVYPRRFNRIKSHYLIELLQQTLRIYSLTFDPSGSILLVRQPIEDIHSGIIQCVDRSKLRHLDILVPDISRVEVLLERFLNLYSIRFCFHGGSINE